MVTRPHQRLIPMSYHRPLNTTNRRLNIILNLTTNHNLISSHNLNLNTTRPNSTGTTHLHPLDMHRITLTLVMRGACRIRMVTAVTDKEAPRPSPYLRRVPGTNSIPIKPINPMTARWVDQA